MSAELREAWVCGDGCGLRVRDADGRPIPEPKTWDAGRCPVCRIERERQEKGAEAAEDLRHKIFGGRRRSPGPFGHSRPDEKPKPKPEPKSVQVDPAKQAAVLDSLRNTYDTDAGIAKRIGVPISVVVSTRDRENIPTSTERKAKARREQVRVVVAEHPEWTTRQVADHLGLPHGSVSYDRQALGLEGTNRKQSRKNARRARIAAYAEEHPDDTNQEIADALGLSPRTVQKDRYALRVASENALDSDDSTSTLARPES